MDPAFKAPQGRKRKAGDDDTDQQQQPPPAAASSPKKKRPLTAEAKERHRVCNRLGARRARAQARLDMEVRP